MSEVHCAAGCHYAMFASFSLTRRCLVTTNLRVIHPLPHYTGFPRSIASIHLLPLRGPKLRTNAIRFRTFATNEHGPQPSDDSKSSSSFEQRLWRKVRQKSQNNSDKSSQEDGNDNEPKISNNFRYLLITLGAVGLIYWIYDSSKEQATEIYFNQFVRDLVLLELVESVDVVNGSLVRVYLRSGVGIGQSHRNPTYYFNIPSLEWWENSLAELETRCKMENIAVVPVSYVRDTNYFALLVDNSATIIWLGFLSILLMKVSHRARAMLKKGASGPTSIFSIGKSRSRRFKKSKSDIHFKDVAGLKEAKTEILEFVSYLKNPVRYKSFGAKLPRGALLTGPPGTGKTLLARATAGEADVAFFSTTGSEFLEMFVGVGPSRVRDLFSQARSAAPCIVFIDEIDAIGRQRGSRAGMSNDEREATLNQLLVEMDGFSSGSAKQPVVVMAGTNRPDVLDKALLRPGRFDRIINLDLPDVQARREILLVHLAKLTLQEPAETIVDRLATMTPGFSGADLANVVNEAALIAARVDAPSVAIPHFASAVERVVAGLERRSLVITPSEKVTVSYHEAGHATVSWFLKYGSPLVKISIVPRGRGLGYAMYQPEERNLILSEQLNDMIAVALGGRAAEALEFGVVTTGAQDDLQRVTQLAYRQIMLHGMCNATGPTAFGSLKDDGTIGRQISDDTAQLIDEQARQMIQTSYDRAIAILTEKRGAFRRLARELLEHEVIGVEDCETILGPRPFHKKTSCQIEPEGP